MSDQPQQPGEVAIWDTAAGPRFSEVDRESIIEKFKARAAEGYYPPLYACPEGQSAPFPRHRIGCVVALRWCGTKLLATLDVEHSACIGAPDDLLEVAIVRGGTVPRGKR